jgi:hypothetical protein
MDSAMDEDADSAMDVDGENGIPPKPRLARDESAQPVSSMTWNLKSASRRLDCAHRAASITLRRLFESLAPPNLLTSNCFVGRVS